MTSAPCLTMVQSTLGEGVDDMENLEVFHFEENKRSFEDFALINGECRWYARDLMKCLGYDDWRAFDNNAVNRAVSACIALKLSVQEHFHQCKRIVNGQEVDDFKLTRFACYLIAMNGDPRKPQVAAAQAYFATLADTVRRYLEETENVERVLIREDISEREKSLSSAAKQAGVQQYGYFQNAGYRGMYNMNLSQLRQRRGIPTGVTPLDYMGKTELAGNLFRITQTEEKIKNDNIRGQAALEQVAHVVGKTVRKTMIELGGTAPEKLPIREDIKEVKKGLKTAAKEFKKRDTRKVLK